MGFAQNPISRVQSATGNTGSSAAATISVTMSTAPVNGNSLIAVISTRSTTANTVTSITQTGATWTRATQATNANGTTTEIWFAPNVSGAATAITINQSSFRSAAVVIEYNGILTASALDKTANTTGNSTTASTGTTSTTTQANELLIGGVGLVSSSYTLGTISGSFTTVANTASTHSTATRNARVYALERIVTATLAATTGGTVSTSSEWSGAIATFKAAAINTVGAASSSPTLCINTALTNITHTTTGGTGIGTATGLPAGVSPAFASNTITISGTPTASGTFTYSIPLTGGAGFVNATGTITVSPASVGGTIAGSATVCTGTNSTTLTLSGHTGAITRWESSTSSTFASAVTGIANTTTTLTATNLTTTTYYRAVITSGSCAAANSATVMVTVTPASVGGTIAGSATVCRGTNSTTLTLSGYTGAITRWESSTSSTFASAVTSIANSTTTLTASNLTTTTYYRAVITSGGCSPVNSSPLRITVNPNNTTSAASSTPTLYINTVLTNITHTTTGATGIGTAIGLPAGVSAAWSANTITISGTPTASGIFNYSIPLTGGCGSVNATGIITVTSENTWLGVNTNWNDPLNWSIEVPISTTNVRIPSGLSNYPSINSVGVVQTNDLTVESAVTVTVNGIIKIAGTISNSGTLIVSAGTVELNGTSAQTIPASTFAGNTIKNLTINNAAGVTLSGVLNITGAYTPTSGTCRTGGYLNLKSSALSTTYIAAGSSSGGYITGNVTVERYMSASSNRAYRLITPGVTTTTSIRANWQEGVNNNVIGTNVTSPIAGYGTHITGTGGDANGFDVTQTNAASLYRWSNSLQNWIVATNTKFNTLAADSAYLLFVRGNRDNIATLTTTTGSSNVILRATGTLKQGTQLFTGLGGSGLVSLVANPYASPVNWTSIYTGTNATNFSAYFNIWDPNIGTRGGFVTVHPTFGTSNGVSLLTNDIQGGQAFFVTTKSGISNPTLTIQESDKSTISNLDVFRTGLQTEKLNIQLKYTSNSIDRSADGVLAIFNNNFSNAVDDNDAEQIQNWDEDVAILNSGKELSIESRNLADANDTLFLQTLRLRLAQSTYRWEIQPLNFNAPGIEAWLHDTFTNSSTQISLSAATTVNFTVTSNTASLAAYRFKIVFKNNAALPVTINKVNAFQNGSSIEVAWNTANETNINSYEVENSTDGQQFKKMAAVASNSNASSNSYTAIDLNPLAGNHYYRIKVIEKNGSYSYSQIVRVTLGKSGAEQVNIYPNPVTGNQINMQLINVKQGLYTLRLIDKQGKVMLQQQLEHSGGSSTQSIMINKGMANGSYLLELSDGKGFVSVQTILKQ